jgi:hypothetical protein
MIKIFKTNAATLTRKWRCRFVKEGEDCLCGKAGCLRFVWNCQITFKNAKKGEKGDGTLAAQRNRCVQGSVDDTNEV